MGDRRVCLCVVLQKGERRKEGGREGRKEGRKEEGRKERKEGKRREGRRKKRRKKGGRQERKEDEEERMADSAKEELIGFRCSHNLIGWNQFDTTTLNCGSVGASDLNMASKADRALRESDRPKVTQSC
ncbi:hypothetical protein L345_13517, partial [Ophiophagus hannah]